MADRKKQLRISRLHCATSRLLRSSRIRRWTASRSGIPCETLYARLDPPQMVKPKKDDLDLDGEPLSTQASRHLHLVHSVHLLRALQSRFELLGICIFFRASPRIPLLRPDTQSR